MIDKDLKTIADHFGEEKQQKKLIEEIGELLQALIKFDTNDNHENKLHLAEEIGDVENCLDQIKYLITGDYTVQEVKKQKIQRTLERIESRYYKK
jgi:NTP pyrophosphatase (non-canonical NTP hydrolase)